LLEKSRIAGLDIGDHICSHVIQLCRILQRTNSPFPATGLC
jgi:hypothetical protein